MVTVPSTASPYFGDRFRSGQRGGIDRTVNAIYKVNVIHETPSETSAARPASPRARRRARRRDEIVAKALELLGEEGLEGLTMARLATELDLTPGALYRYFSGKDALVVEMQAVCIDRMVQRFEAEPRTHVDDPVEGALAELIRTAVFYARLPDEDPSTYRLISLTLATPDPVVTDEAASRVREPLERAFSMIARRMAGAVEVGALTAGDPVGRSVLLWSAVQGVVQTGKLDRLAPGLFTPLPRVTQLVETLLCGWGAPASPLARALATLASQETTP